MKEIEAEKIRIYEFPDSDEDDDDNKLNKLKVNQQIVAFN